MTNAHVSPSTRPVSIRSLLFRGKLILIMTMVWIGLGARGWTAATPSHIYDLTTSFADTKGGPSLVPLGGSLIPGTGYVFAPNQGLNLSNSLVDPASYSIHLIFQIDTTTGFRKFLDMHDLTDDSEWYNINGFMQFFSLTAGTDTVFSPGVMVDVLVNRDGATGLVQGFANGVLQVSFVDSGGAGIFDRPNNIMRFFQDDFSTGQSEASGGTVTRIEIFDGPSTPPAGCSPGSPAPISGSTGVQGVLDSASWPAGAFSSRINTDTGMMSFFDISGAPVGTPFTLPGSRTTPPAFPNGLNFSRVHLGAGTNLAFMTTQTGRQPPVILLSCQDVVLDAGSTLAASPLTGPGPVPDAFMGAAPTASFVSPAGFGPRSGIMPTAGTLFPAVGGSGGDGGAGGIESFGPGGGGGGSAFVISAAQRISVNGTLSAMGLNATLTTAPGAQGGAGGSVRLASLLVEGAGSILTNGGADSDGVVRSPAGPVEIEAFLQDIFSGTTVGAAIRGNAPVQAIPDHLPAISIDDVSSTFPVFHGFGFTNTGSLSTPDVMTFPTPPGPAVDVMLSISTLLVPDGTVLAVRAVGTDGSSFSTTAIVSGASAAATLTLNAGTTYQITAVPSIAFPSTRDAGGVTVAAESVLKPSRMTFGATSANQWMRAFGVGTEQALNRTQTSPARN